MCHADDSRPPAPPRSGVLGEATCLHLTSADGTRFLAYRAMPRVPGRAGVVILPDVRGLHRFYQAFARSVARTGSAAIAIDYYSRNLPDGARTEPIGEMMSLAARLTPEQVAADVRAATDHLRERGISSVFTLGFCLGGSHSWLQSAFDPGLAGCIGFYGRPSDCRAYVPQMRVPLLLLGAGSDALTPQADFDRFIAELTVAGVSHTSVSYPGAPHAFFDHASSEHAGACADAWDRVLRFIDEHSDAPAGAAR